MILDLAAEVRYLVDSWPLLEFYNDRKSLLRATNHSYSVLLSSAISIHSHSKVPGESYHSRGRQSHPGFCKLSPCKTGFFDPCEADRLVFSIHGWTMGTSFF